MGNDDLASLATTCSKKKSKVCGKMMALVILYRKSTVRAGTIKYARLVCRLSS